jgi:mRNA interferase RelE/StbE
MKIRIEKSFGRDVDNIKDKKLLQKLRECISKIESTENIRAISRIKKIEGFDAFYRIKIGDYRLGLELFSSNEVILTRFLHRKDIYRYFPKR